MARLIAAFVVYEQLSIRMTPVGTVSEPAIQLHSDYGNVASGFGRLLTIRAIAPDSCHHSLSVAVQPSWPSLSPAARFQAWPIKT
jgi:hypothetical protein